MSCCYFNLSVYILFFLGNNMEEYDLTVLLIAYNEENFLENCVKEVIRMVTPLHLKYEILIVENGSTDNTFNIAKKLANKFPFIVAVHLDIASGTNAMREGYSIARGNIVANLDVDLSTDMSYFNKLMEYTKNYDVVTGSRYLDPSMVKRTFDRHYMSMIYNRVFIRGLLGSKILDNGCGFRAVKREIGKELYDKINDTEEIANKDINPFIAMRFAERMYKIMLFCGYMLILVSNWLLIFPCMILCIVWGIVYSQNNYLWKNKFSQSLLANILGIYPRTLEKFKGKKHQPCRKDFKASLYKSKLQKKLRYSTTPSFNCLSSM